MGEARQRKLAKLAGRPWKEDVPKPPEPSRYLGEDGKWHEYPVVRRRPNLRALSIIAAMSAMSGK